MRPLILALAISLPRWLPAQDSALADNPAPAEQSSGRSDRGNNFVYGDKVEMCGRTRLYVDTGPDLKQREEIIKRVRGKVRGLVITDPESADLFLYYRGSKVESCRRGGIIIPLDNGGAVVTRNCRNKKVGFGIVSRRGEDGRVRLLLSEEGGPDAFAKAFIKAYKEVND